MQKSFFFSKMTRLLSPVIFQKYYYSRDMPSNLENSSFDLVFKRQFESILISKIDLFFDDCKIFLIRTLRIRNKDEKIVSLRQEIVVATQSSETESRFDVV